MFYQLFFEQGQDSMFIIRTSDGRIIKVNEAAVNTYGYSRDEMLVMCLQDLFDPATVNTIESIKAGTLNEFTIETRHGRKDGGTFPVEVSIKSVAAEEGILLLGTVRNMAKRGSALEKIKKAEESQRHNIENINDVLFTIDTKGCVTYISPVVGRSAVQRKWSEDDLTQSEEKLRRANQQLLDIIDFLPDATFVIDLGGQVIAWNHAIEKITGVRKEDIIGKGDYAYAIPFYAKPRPILIDLVFMGQSEVKLQYDYVRREGDTFFGETFVPSVYRGRGAFLWGKASPLYDQDGNIAGAIESIRDISGLKRLEELIQMTGKELQLALEKLSERELMDRIIQTSPAGILVVNSAMEVIFANARAEQLLGLKIKDKARRTYKKPVWSVIDDKGNPISDEEFVYRYVITTGKQVHDVANTLQWPDGTKTLLSINAAPLMGRSGRIDGAVLSIEDVTGRKEIEEKINSYQKQLRSLAAQLSLVEERERRRIAEGIHDHIGQSLAVSRLKMRALKRAASLVDVLAGLDEIIVIIEEVIMKTRSLTFELSPPVLYDLGFEAVVEWLGEQVLERNGVDVSLNSELKSKSLDEDVRIFLFTAVRELFFNIIKHARAQKVFIDIQELGEKIMVTVRDNGIGFDTRLLGPSPGKKAGFGLFSIRERLEHLGGRLEIVSRHGFGTSVSIEAPFENRH